MLHLFVESDAGAQLHDAAIDASSQIAALQQVFKEVTVLPFLPLNDRREDQKSRPQRQPRDAVDDLFRRLRGDRPATLRAVTLADAREEHTQVIENFGDRADGRTRVASAGLLLDRDRRRQAGNRIDLRLLHLAEELARVRRKRLDVPPLPFRVECVERQRTFARTADAGHHDQSVLRQPQVDALQVVLASPVNDDLGFGHDAPQTTSAVR